MKNTVIAITGNVATGKSTIARLLSSQTGIPVYDIQEYRDRVYGPGKVGTLRRWELLTSEIRHNKVAILESSGLSVYEGKVYKHFEQKIIVRLDCSDERILLNRIDSRISAMGLPPIHGNIITYNKDIVSTRAKLYQKVNSDLVFDIAKTSAETIAKEIRLHLSLKL